MATAIKAPEKRAFSFLKINEPLPKPRLVGMTEIRGPYYTPLGLEYLKDLLEMMAPAIDALKFAGGSFALLPEKHVKAIIDLCHQYDVQVSTGGFIEYVLTQGKETVHQYIRECQRLEFDIIELSAGFITLPTDDWLRLIETVHRHGLKAKPEVGIQFGAGGGTSVQELGTKDIADPEWAIQRARRFLSAGAYLIMIESEGITESVTQWRTEIPGKFVNALGLEHVMFEASDPAVFSWYIQHYGPDVNLFVDHSQIVQLQALRAGIWGTKNLWGRVQTFRADT